MKRCYFPHAVRRVDYLKLCKMTQNKAMDRLYYPGNPKRVMALYTYKRGVVYYFPITGFDSEKIQTLLFGVYLESAPDPTTDLFSAA